MNKSDFLSATTIAQCSYCENKLALDIRFGKKTSESEERARARGDEEHLRHHLAAVKHGRTKDGRCFVASEVYGPLADETDVLRNFRDTVLLGTWYGRLFVRVYYDISPGLVVMIQALPKLKKPAKYTLDFIVKAVMK